MRWVAWLLLAFAAAVGMSILMRFNHGNIAILWPPYRIEMSANMGIALIAIGFVVLHLVLVGAKKALALPQRVREYRARRQYEKSTLALRDSLLAFFEGRLSRVEKLARVAQNSTATAAPAALIAARSAQRMQDFERRDRWLTNASNDPAARNAVLMTQAELAVEERQPGEAISIIERLHERGPREIATMGTALRAYEQAERWDKVLPTLRLLEQKKALPAGAIRRLRVKAVAQLLVPREGDPAAIRELWRSLKADEQTLPEIVSLVVDALAKSGAPDDAKRIAESALDAAYSESVMAAYGRLNEVSVRDRLQRVETWRTRYGDEPQLMLTLGRLCSREGVWGKAEEYLKLAVDRQPSVTTHVALAELYDAVDRPDEAARQYRMAGRLALGEAPLDPPRLIASEPLPQLGN